MRPVVEKYKKYYESGFWTYDMVMNLLQKGKITQEEFDYIIGG